MKMDVSSDISYEPMEIDQSSNSSEVLSNSPVKKELNQDTVDYQKPDLNKSPTERIETKKKPSLKVYHIKHERKEKKNWKVVKIYTSAIVLLISIALYFIVSIKCSEKLDLNNLKETLTKHLFGQPQAVNLMIEFLNTSALSKIMFLCGGTGVGKTFTISLMMEKLQNASNVYHYTMPGFTNTFSPDLLLGMALCDNSILIVDDLTPKDLSINVTIKQVIEKSQNFNKNLTVILVFNCDKVSENFHKKCDDMFYNDLQDSFKDLTTFQKVIKFLPLTNDDLKKCIKRELSGREVNELEMTNIMKHFNVELDGCKGVYTKVKFLNAV